MIRPPDAPKKIPAWVWKWLKWRQSHKAPVVPVPRDIAMFDSVTISEIPAYAQAVAGYVSGAWPTYAKLVTQFPHAHKLSVATNAQANAQALDIEKGDATASQAPAWVKRQLARGVWRPVIYCSVSNASSVLTVLRSAGIGRENIRLWTAHYTEKPHRCNAACGFPGNADATQWTSHALGRNLDQSLCSPTFFS